MWVSPSQKLEDDMSASVDAAPAGPAPQKSAPAPTSSPAPAASGPAPTATISVQAGPRGDTAGHGRFYTPLVKKMAQKNNVSLSELASITGSGAGGRVNRADFEVYLVNRGDSGGNKTATPAAPVPTTSSSAPVAATVTGREERVPMDNMRKAIARNMVQSKLTSPHVNSVSDVDLTHLVKFREGFKVEFKKQEGFNLTYTPFIMWAIIQALKEYPMVNASIDGDDIVMKKDINLGCAVAVPGNGLVVPVIKGADTLNMTGLCRQIDSLAHKARAKKLTMEELTGGTFTFTNVGSFGTLLATPVILQPQVGIYAAGVIQKRVVVMKDDSIGVRSMMYGTHTYDHRLVDGELGGKFLESVHRNLRELDPSQLF